MDLQKQNQNSSIASAPIPKRLAGKLFEIMKLLTDVPKTGRNEKENYDYTEHKNLVPKFRQAMIAQGLFLTTRVLSSTREGNLTRVRMQYNLQDVENEESFAIEIEGEGYDAEDKAIYKAMTGAHKYFILETFNLASIDDPEKTSAAAPSAQRPAAQPQARQQQNAQREPAPAQDTTPQNQQQRRAPNGSKPQQSAAGRTVSLSEKQIKRLFAIGRENAWTIDEVKEYVNRAFRCAKPDSMKKPQYDAICKLMTETTFDDAIQTVPVR